MLRFTKPTRAEMASYQQSCLRLPWSYPQIGATRGLPPAGYRTADFQIVLGTGREVFAAARQALQRWQMMPPSWVDVYDPATTIRSGNVVTTWVRTPGVGVMACCRIAYVVDQGALSEQGGGISYSRDKLRGQYGFAYGTLTDHVLQGEELFTVTWHEDNQVRYRIHCFARPAAWWCTLATPYLRFWQRRFRQHSAAAMRTAVQLTAKRQSPDRFPAEKQLVVG